MKTKMFVLSAALLLLAPLTASAAHTYDLRAVSPGLYKYYIDDSAKQYSVYYGDDTWLHGGFHAVPYPGNVHYDGPSIARLCEDVAHDSSATSYTVGHYVSPGDNNVFQWNGSKWINHPANWDNNYVNDLVCLAPTPTCTVTFDKNPINYGETTKIHWDSNYATNFWLNQFGYVMEDKPGTATIGPSVTTDYTCKVWGDGNPNGPITHNHDLTVNPPAAPAVTLTADSIAFPLGGSTQIHATFAAASNDSLTHDNIDSPVGTGWGATTNPDASKTITFTPPSEGTYTFYARATTGYYTTWTTYKTLTIVVGPAPSCTVSFSQNPIAQGQSATINWTSSNTGSFSINNIGSVTPNANGSTSVSPSQSTDYTGTVSNGAVTNTCKAANGNPQGTLNVSCTPKYTCSGSTIQYTNATCQVSNVTSCVSPAFCSAGSSVCLYQPPSFNQSGSGPATLTGHLQVNPSILPAGTATTVSWNVTNVSSCSVTGTNGASWNTTSGSQQTTIQQQTVFTLSCTGFDGSTVHETQTVGIVPVFREN